MNPEALKVAVYKRLPRTLQTWAVRLATPNFTVGAIGLITDDGSRLLLVRPTYRNGWLPPGGFLGRRETPVEAIEREVEEELGVQMRFAEPHRVYFDVRRQSVTFISVGVFPAGATAVITGPELDEVGWYPLDALPSPPDDFHEGLHPEDLEAVRRAAG